MIQWISQNVPLITYLVFFVCTMFFSLVINGLFLRFFKTLGIRNNADGTIIRWGALSKPSVGGISFYLIFLLSMSSYSILFDTPREVYQDGFIGLLLACACGFLIGLADDAYDTRPWLKFGIQVLSGVVLISAGIQINLFENQLANYLLTLFWVVGIMNSVNMLDNMDGITSVVSCSVIANTIYRIIRHQDILNIHLLVLLGVLAALIGFLRFNWNPSKMYMGDTGSQFLGVFLATMGLIYFWNDPYSVQPPSTGRIFAMTAITFILPIIDTTVVVFNRLSKGHSPFVGGKDHTTHSLAYLGLSDRQVAIVFVMLGLVSFVMLVMIEEFLNNWEHLYTAFFAVYFTGLLSFFFYTTRNKKVKSRERLHSIVSGRTEPVRTH